MASRVHVTHGSQSHHTDGPPYPEWTIAEMTDGRVREFTAMCWCLPVVMWEPNGGVVIVHRKFMRDLIDA